jgi:hypothetical protein
MLVQQISQEGIMQKPKERHEQDHSSHLLEIQKATEVTRRGFIQYSTFALVAAVFSTSFPGCGGGGGEGDSVSNEPLFNQDNVGIGHVLEIKSIDSPGLSNIPEDIFSVTVRVDDTVSYGLRPTYFKEDWIGVVMPPMIQAEDESYFGSKDVEVSLSVRGSLMGKFTTKMNQNSSATTCGDSLLSLIDEIGTELTSIEDEKGTLFQDAILLEKWNSMYPKVRNELDALYTTIFSVCEGDVLEVTTIGGDIYNVTPEDVAMAEQIIDYLSANEPQGMGNGFIDSILEPGGTAIRKLTVVLGYAIPGAFLAMTREWNGSISGDGTIAAIITASIPAASMCIAGNCLRLLAEPETAADQIMNGVNWYANILMNQGLYALNDQMICDFGENSSEIRRLVTQDSIELLEDLSDSLWNDTPWSNSTPWSNGTPYTVNGNNPRFLTLTPTLSHRERELKEVAINGRSKDIDLTPISKWYPSTP